MCMKVYEIFRYLGDIGVFVLLKMSCQVNKLGPAVGEGTE